MELLLFGWVVVLLLSLPRYCHHRSQQQQQRQQRQLTVTRSGASYTILYGDDSVYVELSDTTWSVNKMDHKHEHYLK
jgi:hypothetical protein